MLFFLSLVVLMLFPGIAVPAEKTRFAGEPLLLGVGARPLGLGGAFVAIADDASALYWNPAGLASLGQKEIQVQHAEQFGGSVNHDVISLGFPLQAGGVGLGIVRLGVDGISLTTLEDPTRPLGPDNRPVVSRVVGVTDYALHLGHARRLGGPLSLGATVKIIRRNLVVGSGSGYSVDLGLLYHPEKPFRLGAAVRNATRSRITYDSGATDPLAPLLHFGAAATFPLPALDSEVTGSFSLDAGGDQTEKDEWQGLSLGVEYRLKRRVALRGGLQDGRMTLGAGLKIRRFALDLAFLEHAHLDHSYRLSASLFF